MGLRSFVAKRLANFLLRHGDLDHRLQSRQRTCLFETRPLDDNEVDLASSSFSSSVPLLLAYRREEVPQEWQLPPQCVAVALQPAPPPQGPLVPSSYSEYHAAVLWMASAIIARRLHLMTTNDRRRSNSSSSRSSRERSSSSAYVRLARAFEVAPFALATASTCLATAYLVLSYFAERAAERSAKLEWLTSAISEETLCASSLWLALTSLSLALASATRDAMMTNPVMKGSTPTTARRRFDVAYETAALLSVAAVLVLSYVRLPILRRVLDDEIDTTNLLGLPPLIGRMLGQAASSFLGYCAFSILIPIRPPAQSTPTAPPSEGGTRIRKRQAAADPELIRRMSALAKEARERVEARSRGGIKKPLRRTYSEGNFGNFKTTGTSSSLSSLSPAAAAPVTPQERRQSAASFGTRGRMLLASLPEHGHRQESKGNDGGRTNGGRLDYSPKRPIPALKYSPNSPLNDIHSMGPTLSSSDLLAKLKESQQRRGARRDDDAPLGGRKKKESEGTRPMNRSLSVPYFAENNGLSSTTGATPFSEGGLGVPHLPEDEGISF